MSPFLLYRLLFTNAENAVWVARITVSLLRSRGSPSRKYESKRLELNDVKKEGSQLRLPSN